MKSIYIAGPITGKPYFREVFNIAELTLLHKGWIVLNPARLPAGLSESAYMDICLAMVRSADAMVMLDGWDDSNGASCEHLLAVKMGKKIAYSVRDVAAINQN